MKCCRSICPRMPPSDPGATSGSDHYHHWITTMACHHCCHLHAIGSTRWVEEGALRHLTSSDLCATSLNRHAIAGSMLPGIEFFPIAYFDSRSLLLSQFSKFPLCTRVIATRSDLCSCAISQEGEDPSDLPCSYCLPSRLPPYRAYAYVPLVVVTGLVATTRTCMPLPMRHCWSRCRHCL
ncbi:hypothetical protein COCNU_16G000210 [Cocos nucifera]|uniref:Uncharacterized protein n=1 Tax=Cocos nucifera TaxID=13894 RepID=A0A8K0NDN4_COCNU|nr:hypothetical protein COCNU_16G000210 [Cocos nucifera]